MAIRRILANGRKIRLLDWIGRVYCRMSRSLTSVAVERAPMTSPDTAADPGSPSTRRRLFTYVGGETTPEARMYLSAGIMARPGEKLSIRSYSMAQRDNPAPEDVAETDWAKINAFMAGYGKSRCESWMSPEEKRIDHERCLTAPWGQLRDPTPKPKSFTLASRMKRFVSKSVAKCWSLAIWVGFGLLIAWGLWRVVRIFA